MGEYKDIKNDALNVFSASDAISGTKSCFLFVTFLGSHPMISTSQVQLYKLLGLTLTIQYFINQQKRLQIFDTKVVQASRIYTQTKATIKFLSKKMEVLARELEGQINPAFR